MEEKKVLYSKRFPKESFDELSEEAKQLNKELKMNDDIPDGESILEFLEKKRTFAPNEKRLEKKDKFTGIAKELSEAFEIDADIYEYDTYCEAYFYLECAAYMGLIKKMFTVLFVLADEFHIFPPKEDEEHVVTLALTYHTHDVFFNGRKTTDFD